MGEHKVIMEDRQVTTVTDVVDVSNFNEENVMLVLAQGGMQIKGDGLQVKQLNIGEGKVVIEGSVNSVIYTKKKAKGEGGGMLSKILK